MRILEGALFNLALINKITLEQAKILRALYDNKTLTTYELSKEIGLSEGVIVIEINDLFERKIVSEKFSFYFLENFEEKISNLIREEKITRKRVEELVMRR